MAYGDASSYSATDEMEVDEDEDQDTDWYYAVAIGRCRGIFTAWGTR
ncbi:hypothetical protein PF003_g25325 [Phytophthora fragariae]|nr:hypothetical protein PF003_g25325 [Phytophthora fragariae]